MAKRYQIINKVGGTLLSRAVISESECEAWFDTHPYHAEKSREVIKQPKGRELIRISVAERAE